MSPGAYPISRPVYGNAFDYVSTLLDKEQIADGTRREKRTLEKKGKKKLLVTL